MIGQKNKKLKTEPFKKYGNGTCIMAFFTSFNYSSHFVNLTLTLPLCVITKYTKNERKEDYLRI